MMIETIDWMSVPIRAVTSRTDPTLAGLFDIYQKSFPVEEQMLVSYFLDKLRAFEQGEAQEFHLVVLAQECSVAGFAYFEVGRCVEGVGIGGYLWYIASHPELRRLGVGKRLYDHVRDTMFTRHNCRAMFFEIEVSDDARARHGEQAAAYADWRKSWYKRQGALELRGTRYMCGVDWHPPIPMQVMVHPNGELTPEEALRMARDVQDESIEAVGTLALM